MKDAAHDQRLLSGWALPASLAAHALVVLLVIFGLPLPLLEPDHETAMKVDLVPPPEESSAEPPPEKPKETEKAETEEPPPAEDEAARRAAEPVISPVFQFGDRDAGPREARDGNRAKEGSASPAAGPAPEKQEPRESPALAAARSQDAVPDQGAPAAPPPSSEVAAKQEGKKLRKAEKLFSRQATGDVLATTAMGRLPRGVRGGRLCVTELREQLRNAWPPYYPDLLPSFRLEDGATVIDASRAAFRVNGEWYDLGYRCEVDRDATRVVAFAFRVGELLPPGERQRRGLPSR